MTPVLRISRRLGPPAACWGANQITSALKECLVIASDKAYLVSGRTFGGSDCIATINNDPDAPIFDVAGCGVVGSLFKVLPVLADEIKKARD